MKLGRTAPSRLTWKVYQNYPKGMTTVLDIIYFMFYQINEKKLNHNGV
jgi:hypothetical protein